MRDRQDDHSHRHWGPPWAQGGSGGPPPDWHSRKGGLFLRLTMVFGFMVLLVVGGMAALAFIITKAVGGGGSTAVIVWIAGLGLALALPVVAISLAMRGFRRIASPLGDVMATADAVAAGDLSARVPASSDGSFDRLAGSFNRMVDELQRTDQLRRNLTADVAHELRTPLQIIQGNLEGVLDGVYSPTEDHVASTLEEARLFGRLVEDLGTLSLAESGQLSLTNERLDVSEFLADVTAAFKAQAEAVGIELTTDEAGDGGLIVEADVGRLQQVLGNLVTNALHHTPSGGRITLGAEGDGGAVLIRVADTGSGIPEEDLPLIFDRFWRGERSRSRSATAGGGLGLAIARQLVQANGGRISANSEVGRGTRFTIELPAAGTGGADRELTS